MPNLAESAPELIDHARALIHNAARVAGAAALGDPVWDLADRDLIDAYLKVLDRAERLLDLAMAP